MGPFRARARTIGLFLIGVHLTGAAAAAERISMPFDCRYDGARVRLTPSPERSYTILGQHEGEIFSACSPADPNRCRSWFVHRFDLDCNGARVAWLDVAAAARRYYRRPGWVEDGRFHVRMGPMWTFEGGGAFREGERRWLRERDRPGAAGYEGADRPYRDARVVTLPPGFAPSRGIPVTFSRAPDSGLADNRRPDDRLPRDRFADDGYADDGYAGGRFANERSTAGSSTAAAPHDAPPQSDLARAAPPEPQPVPELPERAPPRREIAAAPTPAPSAPTAPEASDKKTTTNAKSPAAVSKSQSPGLTIINAPNAAQSASSSNASDTADETQSETAEVSADETSVADASEAAKPDDISTGSTETSRAGEDVVAAADPGAGQAPPMMSSPPVSSTPTSMVTPTTIAAALALALAAVVAAMRLRRRGPELVRVTPPSARDYSSVSLGGFGSSSTSREVSLDVRPEPPPPQTDTSADRSGADSLGVAPDFPIPSSYEQALDILGASPDASLGAIKKIVDGLRQNWHPDLARSESDRLYRESRSRQINVAWDLVSRHRSAA